ncbi:MAG: aminotransferase class I/II-fold pyridoxal phosphate-dependent enzyme, partial [Defluviitaleaceae bacterium]|nr:aminotransferase class I/II-fold pyridoxal phosphate-dependent enzyme [Defluviitaleaceae bacterium]
MYKQIFAQHSGDIYPFHMPGHKRNSEFFPPNLLSLDVTEIPGTDVLSAPDGIIKDFQQRLADFYNAKESFFLVNGSTTGIIASVCCLCNTEKKEILFAPRNAHVSLYNGLVFSGAVPVYYLPEITPDGLAGGVSPEVFDKMPRGATAFVVSPTYEGFVSDIAAISEKVHARDGVLIVDEAHGAHFPFHKSFPKPALALGADIVVNSLHKTLPTLSGCAVLHINHNVSVNASRMQFFINAVQTASPSYMHMTTADFTLKKLWAQPDLFEQYVERIAQIRLAHADAECFKISGCERIGTNAIFDVDKGKLLYTLNSLTAEKFSETLAREYKIQAETAVGRHLLFMTSVADTQNGFDRLKNALLLTPRLKFAKQTPITPLKGGIATPTLRKGLIGV